MLDRSIAPPLRHSLDFHLPNWSAFTQSAGMEALIVPSDRQPVVRVEFIIPAGKITEAHPGVAHFTSAMLEKGTVRLDSEAIASQLDFYSAYLYVNSSFDDVVVSLYCLTRNLRAVLPLVIELLTEPSFQSDELELTRNIFIDELRVNMEKTSWLASSRIRALLFGNHAYGTTTLPDSAEVIEASWLREHFKAYYQPSLVMVSGSMEQEDLAYLAEVLERTWPNVSTRTSWQAPIPDMTNLAGMTERIPRESAVQCAIRFGRPGMERTHPDYPAMRMAGHILGGFFGSRLMKSIREEKGLTYGINAYVQHMDLAGMMIIGAEVNKENIDLTLDAIREEMRLLTNVEPDEILTARHHFIGSIQSDVNTIFSAADKIKSLRTNGLPDDYYSEMIRKIDALDTESIREAARKYWDPSAFTATVSG